MDEKILLSIAIPTWNRAKSLGILLDNILQQTKGLEEKIEICISSNGSTDNTGEIVTNFKSRYPNLIKYNEFEKNLGFDVNFLKIVEMSEGDFVWFLGDDDLIVGDGLEKVINYVKKIQRENIGLVLLRTEAFFIDEQTGKRIIYSYTFDKNKPETFKLDKSNVVGPSFPDEGYVSVLIFNGKFLKRIIQEEKKIIEEASGILYTHELLRSLMFMKYNHLDATVLNKCIVLQELSCYQPFVEDKFLLHYRVQKKLNKLLLAYKHISQSQSESIIQSDKKLRKRFTTNMIAMRAFNNYNYSSYFGCLRLFFQYAPFTDALIFSFIFSALIFTPSAVLRFAYKILLMARHGKKWRAQWFLRNNFYSITTKGTRRRKD